MRILMPSYGRSAFGVRSQVHPFWNSILGGFPYGMALCVSGIHSKVTCGSLADRTVK